MNTTKTSNLSHISSQINNNNPKISPSKVKLDIHREVRENEEEDVGNSIRNSSMKKSKKSKKRIKQEEVKVSDLMKIYGL